MLRVVASVLAVVRKRMQQLQTLLGDAVHSKYVSKSFINVSMYLVFTTNWGHKNKNYLQIRNNNNNVYTIKICGMYKLYSKTIGK